MCPDVHSVGTAIVLTRVPLELSKIAGEILSLQAMSDVQERKLSEEDYL